MKKHSLAADRVIRARSRGTETSDILYPPLLADLAEADEHAKEAVQNALKDIRELLRESARKKHADEK